MIPDRNAYYLKKPDDSNQVSIGPKLYKPRTTCMRKETGSEGFSPFGNHWQNHTKKRAVFSIQSRKSEIQGDGEKTDRVSMKMDILGYTILVLILISGLPLLLFALRRGKDHADKTPDESEWYDGNGNHVYYDRKLIRQQQKENAGKAPRVGYVKNKGRYFIFCRVNPICKRH